MGWREKGLKGSKKSCCTNCGTGWQVAVIFRRWGNAGRTVLRMAGNRPWHKRFLWQHRPLDHGLLMKAVERFTQENWILMYGKRCWTFTQKFWFFEIPLQATQSKHKAGKDNRNVFTGISTKAVKKMQTWIREQKVFKDTSKTLMEISQQI